VRRKNQQWQGFFIGEIPLVEVWAVVGAEAACRIPHIAPLWVLVPRQRDDHARKWPRHCLVAVTVRSLCLGPERSFTSRVAFSQSATRGLQGFRAPRDQRTRKFRPRDSVDARGVFRARRTRAAVFLRKKSSLQGLRTGDGLLSACESRASIGDCFLRESRPMFMCAVMGMSLDNESMKRLTLLLLCPPAPQAQWRHNVVHPGAPNQGCQL
jgi:hypothetical protein